VAMLDRVMNSLEAWKTEGVEVGSYRDPCWQHSSSFEWRELVYVGRRERREGREGETHAKLHGRHWHGKERVTTPM